MLSTAPPRDLPGHPVLDALRDFVMPNLHAGGGQVVPAPGREIKDDGDFSHIFSLGMHAHEDFEWMCLLDSFSHIRIGNVMHRLEAGDFCLLAPHVQHAEMTARMSQPYQALWLSYHGAGVFAQIFSYTPGGRGHFVARCSAPTSPSTATLLLLLQGELESGGPHADGIRRSLVTTLMQVTLRSLEAAATSQVDCTEPQYLARRVLDYLHQHYERDICLDDVARAVHLSRNYLAGLFKQETGKTIGEALTDIRLERAKVLLLEDALSVTEVARRAGFGSPEHFSRVFRREIGLAPSRYGKTAAKPPFWKDRKIRQVSGKTDR